MHTVPVIDPNVKHIGVSKLRGLNATTLKEKTTTNTYVIQENDTPLAVLLSYENFLVMQEQMRAVMNTIDLLCDRAEVAGLKAGLDDAAAGRVRSLAEIRADITKAHG
jgi:predicted transcriptional regulator